jgi:hypothetical protein
MKIELSQQSKPGDTIAPKIQQLRTAMDERIPVWTKLSLEQKTKWVKSGKDPIMVLAWQIYKYLRDNFFGDVNDG